MVVVGYLGGVWRRGSKEEVLKQSLVRGMYFLGIPVVCGDGKLSAQDTQTIWNWRW